MNLKKSVVLQFFSGYAHTTDVKETKSRSLAKIGTNYTAIHF